MQVKRPMPCIAVIVCAASILAGCSDSKPSDKLALETVQKNASKYPSLTAVDWVRDNGWADTNKPNIYSVKYTFNYQLEQPVCESVVDTAKKLYAEEVGAAKTTEGDTMGGLQRGVNAMQQNAQLEAWITSMGGRTAYDGRREKFKANCPAIQTIFSKDDSSDIINAKGTQVLVAWMTYSELGYADDAKKGDKVPRWIQANFMKTEKGWAEAQ